MINTLHAYLHDKLMYSAIEQRLVWKEKHVAHDKIRGKPVTLDELIYIITEYITSPPDTSRKDPPEPDIAQVPLPQKQSLY